MSKRKPKPLYIYREEVFAEFPYGNSTRQTFDRRQFDQWVEYNQKYRTDTSKIKTKFYIGQIEWQEACRIL